ncbi:hypothetical protein O1L55_18870 [Streptomyces albulus]|nr:hypothetical protein [Streptomyces noursei]
MPALRPVAARPVRRRLLRGAARTAAGRRGGDRPAPWTAEEDGERWTASLDALHRPGPEGEPALPYALTVTVGLDGPDRVLVDLSRATGPVSVTGPDEEVHSLVRAVIAETLSSPVGALAEVTLVGSLTGAGLVTGDGPHSSRLHTAATLEEAFARAASGAPGQPQPGVSDVTQIFRLIEGSSRIAVQGAAPHLFVVDASQLPRRQGRWTPWGAGTRCWWSARRPRVALAGRCRRHARHRTARPGDHPARGAFRVSLSRLRAPGRPRAVRDCAAPRAGRARRSASAT